MPLNFFDAIKVKEIMPCGEFFRIEIPLSSPLQMISWSNFHTHTSWCDGKSTLTELAEAAAEVKMSAIGFSSHAPLPFPCSWCIRPEDFQAYLRDITAIKASSAIPVFAGLEVDYVPGLIGPSDFKSQLDYTIGSVHFVDGDDEFRWEADTSVELFQKGLNRIFKGDIQRAVCRYFELIREMLSISPPDILGHMDRIKMHNTVEVFFDEQAGWYRDEVVHTLEIARDSGVVIEVNTRGLYKKRSAESYPGSFALRKIREMGIPVMLASDAHHCGELISYFPEVSAELYKIGFRSFRNPGPSGWMEVPCHRL